MHNEVCYRQCSVIDFVIAEDILRCLDNVAEDRTPPGPGDVGHNVGRAVAEWSVVCVKLARLVTGTVVVRVADRRQRTVEHALQTNIHLDSARYFVDHLLSWMICPLPTFDNIKCRMVVISYHKFNPISLRILS